MNHISKRKQDHVDLCVNHNMNHKSKTTGLECYEFIHNALPEINYEDISTASYFLNKEIAAPLFISSMTGGFKGAISINQQLAEIASTLNIPLGIGSLRIALHDSSVHDSFTIIKNIIGDTIPLFGNIGAAEIAQKSNHAPLLSILDKCYADAIAIHLNPLQELLQPEGNPQFKGVLHGIESFVKLYEKPVIVKEVGAGISMNVARKLLDIGVSAIDVAGAGGTSWAGVELSRNSDAKFDNYLWDWGIPTSECIEMIAPFKNTHTFELYASGGIQSAFDIAMSIALGADSVGMAGSIIKSLMNDGNKATLTMIENLIINVKRIMFLTGSHNIEQLKLATIKKK